MKLDIKRRTLVSAMAAIATAGLMAGCSDGDDTPAADAEDTALTFDAAAYTTVNVTIDGVATKVRQYWIVYVANPISFEDRPALATPAAVSAIQSRTQSTK